MKRVLLLGGCSHSGKSTLARAVAERLGWEVLSTDKLARHPGRPWRTPPTPVAPHVVAHYRELSVDELVADVTRHRRDVLVPLVAALVTGRLADPALPGLVVEGSGVLPELGARLVGDAVAGAWLVAGPTLLRERMLSTSRYEERDADGRQLIDTFLARAIRFEEAVAAELERLGLTRLDANRSIDDLAEACRTLVEEG